MNQKVFAVVLGILVFSLVAVSAEQSVATIHVQTFGYEGRDVVTLNVQVTGEDADYLYIAIDAGVLDKLKKEINIEKLPVVKISEAMFKIPRIYLIEVRANEYVVVAPNNVTKMKWCIRDKIKGMNRNDIVRVLVWFKEPYSIDTVKKFGTVYYEFLGGMGAAVDIRVSNIKGLSEAADIEFVEEDGVGQIALSQSVPLINADDCWSAGYDGTGVSICVIDTGIDPNHCDFPSGKIIAWADYIGSSSTPYDDHGHGTSIASIAAGEDTPKGVAPGADLMVVKACTSGGSCPYSAIIQGIDFGVAQGADVEGLSIFNGPGSDGTSAIALKCDWAVDQGVIVCVPAGNSGPSCCTINTPGDARKVITVGASNKSDALASFSSRGPTFDDRTKPDIVAPGVSIYTAQVGTPCSDVDMSGTSVATAHIAGVAALMLDARGTATPIQVKKCMGAAAVDKFNCGKDCLWGWGRVDAYAAVNQIINNPNVTPPDDALDRGCTVEDCGLPLPPTPTVTITNPDDGSHVHGNEMVNITASTQGYINEVKFYLIWITDEDTVTGELLCVDATAPFECSWDTTGYQVWKWYTIRADGYYYDHHLRDVDEITVQLRPPSSTFFPTRIITPNGVLGTALTALFVLFGSVGIMTKKRIKEAMYHARKVNIRGKKTAALTLVMLLSLSIPVALSSTNTLTVKYQFDSALLNECGSWMVEDTHIREIPGEPIIPYRTAYILLSQDAEVRDVKVKHGNPIVQTGIDIPWGQPPCTFSDEPVLVGKNEEVYNSNNLYPEKVFEVTGVNYFRGYAILNLNLYPVQYQPKSGTVHFYENLTVEVKLGKGSKNKLYRGLKADKTDVAGMVDNPDEVSTYEEVPIPLATEEYIIVTSSTLESTFQQLATWKASFVNGASVYTTTWIYSNYTGNDNQDKIRNFIIDKYANNGTKYVLLGGDTGVVPYRGFYIYSGGYSDSDMAADMYYGHLDGNWNNDGDSRFGEPGEEDWYAEVAVGRAPVDNTTQAQAFVDKVIAYEQMEKPDVGSRKRVCFHQSRVQSGNSPDSRCLAYNCDDWIPGGYTIDYLFEETQTISKTVWRNAWSAEPIVVVHIGHGNTSVYYINYELGGTISWYNSDVSSHTNTFFPWTTSVACICGEFEASDCLAEQYVKDDCGAIGAIYNDNYGWFSTGNACMYSGEFCEMEIRACWSDGYEKLGDLLNQSRSYMAGSASSNSTYRWCFYERNLMGDPETPCLTTRGTLPYVTITNPSEGETVCDAVNIAVSTTGCIDEVRFFIDSALKHTDYAEPFQWSWDTCLELEGSHTIRVDGYCSGVYRDSDTVNATVNNKIIMTDPEDGEHVNGTVDITTSASNCVETVKFYLIWITDDGNVTGELLCTDATAPFECSWDTTGYQVWKWYTIRADAYWGGKVKDVDEITVQLRPPSCAMHLGRIITPSGGAGLGTVLVALLILFGSVGMTKRR